MAMLILRDFVSLWCEICDNHYPENINDFYLFLWDLAHQRLHHSKMGMVFYLMSLPHRENGYSVLEKLYQTMIVSYFSYMFKRNLMVYDGNVSSIVAMAMSLSNCYRFRAHIIDLTSLYPSGILATKARRLPISFGAITKSEISNYQIHEYDGLRVMDVPIKSYYFTLIENLSGGDRETLTIFAERLRWILYSIFNTTYMKQDSERLKYCICELYQLKLKVAVRPIFGRIVKEMISIDMKERGLDGLISYVIEGLRLIVDD
jgi:hypothetical protein